MTAKDLQLILSLVNANGGSTFKRAWKNICIYIKKVQKPSRYKPIIPLSCVGCVGGGSRCYTCVRNVKEDRYYKHDD